MRGFVGILVVLLVAVVAGTIGFQAGVAANVSPSVGSTVPAYWWWGPWHVGGFLFGLLFLFLIIGLISVAFGGRRHGPRGHWARRDRWGYGPTWGPAGDPSDPGRQWFADAHRRLHEDEARRAPQSSPAPPRPAADQGPHPDSTAGSGGLPPDPPAAG